MRTSEQTTTLIAALVKARAEFLPIQKDAVGQVGKGTYKYADLSSILEAIMAGLSKQGIVLLHGIDAETASLITRVAHVSGEWVESAYPLGATPNPQAFGSQLTYARRYSIQCLLCLAASDDDGAGAVASGEVKLPAAKKPDPIPTKPVAAVKPAPAKTINTAQQKILFTVAEQAGWSHRQIRDYLLRHVGVEQSKAIPASAFDRLLKAFDIPPEPSASDPA